MTLKWVPNTCTSDPLTLTKKGIAVFFVTQNMLQLLAQPFGCFQQTPWENEEKRQHLAKDQWLAIAPATQTSTDKKDNDPPAN